MGLGDTVQLGNGEEARVGDEVVLLPEFESLVDHPAYGMIRTIERMNTQTADEPVIRVGVLWYGYGGLWVRHYLPSQLALQSYPVQSPKAPEADGIAGYKQRRSTWVTLGQPEDEAEKAKRSWEGDMARPIIKQVIRRMDDERTPVNPQDVLALTLGRLEGPDGAEPDEQLVRDVITEELSERSVRLMNEQRAAEAAEQSDQPTDE